jgi:hypothetical protein
MNMIRDLGMRIPRTACQPASLRVHTAGTYGWNYRDVLRRGRLRHLVRERTQAAQVDTGPAPTWSAGYAVGLQQHAPAELGFSHLFGVGRM